MLTSETIQLSATDEKFNQKVLELTVNNHPGVMSHVCGLFSRRAFNMDGILCMPVNDGKVSRIWIRVDSNGQLEQVVKQLKKLEDVKDVNSHDMGHEVFVRLEDYFKVS